jgi:hypothetical protein
MKKVRFGNKNALKVTSSNIINIIKKNIKDIGTFHLTGKYYNFLNKSNISNIISNESNEYLFTINTYGKKHVLFLTNINDKNYSIFINKKNEIMILSQFKFDESLFQGTLFDGELVRSSDGKWHFLINDLAYYQGINVITKSFDERREILENIYKNMFENDKKISICNVELKEYFEYKYLQSVCEDYIPGKGYKCSGVLFKNMSNFSDNYLYIFLECRSDNKIKNNNQKNKITINLDNKKTKNMFVNNDNNIVYSGKKVENISRNYSVLMLKNTNSPDIYELYCKGSNGQFEKHSYAGVPNMRRSIYLRKLLKNKEINEEESDYSSESDLSDDEFIEINMKCNYHKTFKKWIPFKKTVEDVDDINFINHFEQYMNNKEE